MPRLPLPPLSRIEPKEIPADLMAAVAVCILAVPQGLAYATIAGLPPVMGLYAAAIPPIVGSLFRSSRHVVAGPTNALSLLVWAAVAGVSDDPVSVALTLALMVGVMQVAAGILRLGSVVDYISGPVVLGYITGAGVLIGIGQLHNVTATTGPRGNLLTTVQGWIPVLDEASTLAVGMTLGTIAVVIAVRLLSAKLGRRIPAAVTAMITALVVNVALGLEDRGLRVLSDLSPIPSGFAMPEMPRLADLGTLLPFAVACTVLSLVESSAVARSIAARTGQRLDPSTELLMGTSNPGSCVESDGGVGRNVAEALGRLGCNPVLYSAVGSDLRGQGLLERLHDCGCANRAAVVKDTPTATYLAVLNGSGELHVAIANMAVLEEIAVPPTQVFEQANAQFLVMDANPTVAVLKETAQMATKAGLKVCLEPTSVPKARDLALDPEFLSHITYAFPNVDELLAMAEKLTDRPELTLEDLAAINQLPHIQVAATMVLKQMNPESAHLVITMGDKGVFLASREKEEINKVQHFPAPYGVAVQNATGAGDSLCAAFIASLLAGKSESDAVAFGMQAATLSLQCADRAVSPALNDLRI